MKRDKEYPATHSMSTAWYVADEEGNVGIIDFNENGPVPWETEQTCIEDLVFGHLENFDTKEFLPINLTEDQINDLIEGTHNPNENESWLYGTVIKIDMNKQETFFALANNVDIIIYGLSPQTGIYMMFCKKQFSDKKKHGRKKSLYSSPIRKMLDNKIILKVYDQKQFWMDDEWKEGEVVYEKSFDNAPYYLFQQPYWNKHLPKCMNKPKHPITIDQFPEKLKERVLRLPLKFSETESFQIAEWHPCNFYGDKTIYINGFTYQPITMTDGSQAYVYTSQGGVSFYDYCSEKSFYGCTECSRACCTIYGSEYASRPTVMFVFHPFREYDFGLSVTSDAIIRHSVRIPILHKIPFKHPQGNHMFLDKVKEQVSEDMLIGFFMKNHQHFEDMVLRFNPQVIILDEESKDILFNFYFVNERHITIKENTYPFYMESEIEDKRDEITRLANLPYRGIEMPYIISMEEMKKYKTENNE